MNLIVGLAAVDQATGGKQTQQLTEGWMGWESAVVRRSRLVAAHALARVVARLAPESDGQHPSGRATTRGSA